MCRSQGQGGYGCHQELHVQIASEVVSASVMTML